MLKTIFVVLILLLSAGCSRDGMDTLACFNAIEKKYPDAEVSQMPGKKYRFIVRQADGTIRFVENMNISNAEITADVVVMEGR